MNPTLATYLFEIPPSQAAGVASTIDQLPGWHPRRPPPATEEEQLPAVRPGPRLEDFVHFMSLVVLPPDKSADDERAWLLVEVCADGGEDHLPARLIAAIPDAWSRIFDALGVPTMHAAAQAAYLSGHARGMGTSLFKQPGIRFVGTPGMTVRRIHDEAYLAAAIRKMMRTTGKEAIPAGSALQRLGFVRSKVFESPDLKWALFSEPVPLLADRQSTWAVSQGIKLAIAAVRDYLWVLLLLPLLWTVGEILLFRRDLLSSTGRGLLVFGAEMLVLAMGVGYAYRRLREEEEADDPLDDEPDPKRMEQIMARENYRDVTQNHLAAQSRVKPGWVRRAALRLAMWTVAETIRQRSAPGFLDRIGTIHFARWYVVPGTDRLVFLSNYDGSWQSYLEDFIARLREGLSSLWSNTRDFPRTSRLTDGGAGDGARFKRWARRQQLPTLAWFTAYPDLTTASIRTNAAIRHGLASASTETAAAAWLSRLGYAAPDELENDQVPTLVFGGLAQLRHAHALVVRFQSDDSARRWLNVHLGKVTYGPHAEGRNAKNSPAVVLGFTHAGLRKLGLSEQVLQDFPVAFQQGMQDPLRARLLGDFDGDAKDGPQMPRWGMDGDVVDMLCIAYASDNGALEHLIAELCQGSGPLAEAEIVYQRRMAELPGRGQHTYEVFGFRDGISQPIVRGTRKWSAAKNAMHVVSPGEIVLGYRDNLGRVAPSPRDAVVDYGRNGTFLVVRELAQDREAFDNFLCQQAAQLDSHERLNPTPSQADHAAVAVQANAADEAVASAAEQACCPRDRPRQRTAREQWIAAKMFGRWEDGTPLVRWPNMPPWLDPAKKSAHNGSHDSNPNNDFLFGKEDADGLRCPFGAHIRRANPRDSQDPGSEVQLAISNRHRILRVGRPFRNGGANKEGIFFMCLNADIERQFEFLQQTWLLGPNFHGLDHESDSIFGPGGRDQALTVPHAGGTLRLEPLSRFVRPIGGGYFFLPGKACLESLAKVSQKA